MTTPDHPSGRRRRRWPRVIAAILGIALIAIMLGLAWWLQPQPLLPEAEAALASTPTVEVSDEGGTLVFMPRDVAPRAGLVFYPGGKVEPAAYARSAQAIASAGHLVVIPAMPLNLAVLDAGRAASVMADHPGVDRWVVGGHSLGGAMAGQFADAHPELVDGLALWAAWPNGDLSDEAAMEVAMIYGTLDGGVARITSDETRSSLPPGTRWIPIEGGNHEQMGDYTGQPNDPPAAIPRDEQQAQAVQATLVLLRDVAGVAGS